jgi:lipid II:glycine glycyltransferase (peptidoglycan interpeptide bridge formation enzyme)
MYMAAGGNVEESALKLDSGVTVYQLDPLRDSRWEKLVERHSSGSVFHSTGWLQALRDTYGYESIVYTTTPPDRELANGLVLCRVRSWLTGDRLVSLPFSDHCEPFVDNTEELTVLIDSLKESLRREGLKYFELRPMLSTESADQPYQGLSKSESYYFQSVDLRPDLDTLFRSFHKSCVQRKVHRAEREHLDYEEGRSDVLLMKFYDLMALTRRRHGLPPQPLLWFRNLIRTLQDKVTIRVASKDGQPIASILTIFYKKSLVYKYGCSDSRFHNLGGMAFVFWRAIQDGKRLGAVEYDLGRSEQDNEGLISFKENWAAKSTPLTYYRYPAQRALSDRSIWSARVVKQASSRMPIWVLAAIGRVLYRHIG